MRRADVLAIIAGAYPVPEVGESIDCERGTLEEGHDTLALFLVREVGDVVAEDGPDADQLQAAIDAVAQAERDLTAVRMALTRRLRSLTDPAYRTVRAVICHRGTGADGGMHPVFAADLPVGSATSDHEALDLLAAITRDTTGMPEDGDGAAIAYSYRGRLNRPLQPGDAVCLDGRWYRQEADGWTPLAGPPGPAGSACGGEGP